jgi:glycyl-tRNA synthetase beta chain
VLNVPGDPKGLIRQGHERVLAARFADAEFFWNADQKITLAQRIPMLERVTYQAKLGTYGDKVRRMKTLAENVCTELEKSGGMNAQERQHALRAVELCKCDLTTQMVQEFTELQGIMGGLYAKAQGEPGEVADAIYDHYRPAGIEDSCPRSVAGAVVSLADKLDSVVSGFAVGLEPTGSSDPFGLRRAGNGVVKIVFEVLPSLNLLSLTGMIAGSASQGTLGFLQERTAYYLGCGREIPYDTVRSLSLRDPGLRYDTVFGPEGPDLLRAGWVMKLAETIEAVRDTQDFQALAAAAKRTRNILTKSASADDLAGAEAGVDVAKLVEEPERELYSAYIRLADDLKGFEASGDYEAAFRAMATIRPQVDRFFEKVLVMAEDREVRRNRLRLLTALNKDVFARFADLSQIESSASTSVGAPT